MDLLGNYSDSDAEDNSPAKEPSSQGQQTVQAAPTLRNSAPDPEERPRTQPVKLPKPFADEETERQLSHTTATSPSASKRAFSAVTGSGVLQPAPFKAARTTTSPGGPKPAFNTALVPPQLRNGRANVSTEDVEKMFTKGALATKRATKER